MNKLSSHEGEWVAMDKEDKIIASGTYSSSLKKARKITKNFKLLFVPSFISHCFPHDIIHHDSRVFTKTEQKRD